MKKKEILQMFYDEMNPFFEKWGFKYTRTRLMARKKEGVITKVVYFDAIYFLGRGSFQPDLMIRNELMMQIRGQVKEMYKKDFYTIILDLDGVAKYFNRAELNYLHDDLGDYDCGSYVYEKTMPYFKKHFIIFMEEVGQKFFELFYTHKDFDRWFNDGIFEGKYADGKSVHNTPVYSYIAACIVENPEKEKIFEYWMDYGLYDESRDELIQVKKWLDNNDFRQLKL